MGVQALVNSLSFLFFLGCAVWLILFVIKKQREHRYFKGLQREILEYICKNKGRVKDFALINEFEGKYGIFLLYFALQDLKEKNQIIHQKEMENYLLSSGR